MAAQPLTMSRRDLMRAGVGVGAASLLGACGGDDDARRLAFLNWQDYIDDGLLRDFERQIDGTVTYETYASNDELSKRLGGAGRTRRRGRKGSTFDLIVPSDNLLTRLRDADALLALGTISGLDALDPAMRRTTFDPGNRFSVPWATGTTGLGYSAKAFPDGPPSWSVFLDPTVSGKATILDETRDAMAVALFLLGEDPNTADPSVITAAGRKLAQIAGNGVAFDAVDYLDKLRGGETIVAHAFSTDVAQAAVENPDLEFVVPEAGGLRWIDSLCIPVDAPHPDIARRFIEFYLQPEVSASNAVAVRVDTGNQAAREFVPAALLDDPSVYPPAGELERLVFTKRLADEVEDRYSAAFTEAKGS